MKVISYDNPDVDGQSLTESERGLVEISVSWLRHP